MLELSTTPINFYDDCCKVIYDEIFGTGDVDMYINTIQNTSLWNEERKYRVTGSRIYEIYTYAKRDWEKKSYTYFWPKHFCNKFTIHGIKHEKQAKKVVSENLAKDFGMIVSNSNRWLSYSPDGVIFQNGIPIAVLEIKCIFAGRQANIKEALQSVKYLETIDGNLKLKKCHKYYGQVQLGMAILNLNLCYLVLYSSFDKSFEIVYVYFDYDYCKHMVFTVKEKFFTHMWHNICRQNKEVKE